MSADMESRNEVESTPALIAPPEHRRPAALRVFIGSRGVRAGWKVFLFFLIFGLLGWAANFIVIRSLGKINPKVPFPPGTALLLEFLNMLTVLLATAVMGKWIDRKPWGYFGMPLRNMFRSTFWVGSVVGLGALALQLEVMHIGGWFDFGALQLHGAAILGYGVLWAIVFLCVGVTEEGTMRGYAQRVTTDGLSRLRGGVGFWISAVTFSLLFGAGHLSNPGENKFGIVMVFVDGMAMCFSLWRTGDLWFAIGNHAAWDWGETFLFGTPNSGLIGQHALMKPSFHGPLFWAGGTDGPEGSVLALLSEAIFFIATALIYRRRRYPLRSDEPQIEIS